MLIADSVLSAWLTANAVCSIGSTATNDAAMPVCTAGGVRLQPEVILALHRAPSMTETDPWLNPLPKLAT